MKPYISYSNRSADIQKGNIRCYYGPDELDTRSGDWCFVIWKGDREVFRETNTRLLEVSNGESIKDIIIAGLTLYLK